MGVSGHKGGPPKRVSYHVPAPASHGSAGNPSIVAGLGCIRCAGICGEHTQSKTMNNGWEDIVERSSLEVVSSQQPDAVSFSMICISFY